jgi:hypothetical protein
MTHILACALCGSNPHSEANWAWVLGGLFVFSFVLIIAGMREQNGSKTRRPPREPVDVSPFFAELLSGTRQPAYYGKYRATTPRGVVVTGRCCARLHRSPGLAAAHAEQVKARIEATGR